MKLKVWAFACLLSFFSLTAFAQHIPPNLHITLQPERVTAQVYNSYSRPIICSGQVFGETTYGEVFNTYFNEQYILAGDYRYVFVQTIPRTPFVRGWANFNCRFARQL